MNTQNDLIETIRDLLGSGPMTEAEIVEATGSAWQTVRIALTQMDVAGIVSIDQSGDIPIYQLAP